MENKGKQFKGNGIKKYIKELNASKQTGVPENITVTTVFCIPHAYRNNVWRRILL